MINILAYIIDQLNFEACVVVHTKKVLQFKVQQVIIKYLQYVQLQHLAINDVEEFIYLVAL